MIPLFLISGFLAAAYGWIIFPLVALCLSAYCFLSAVESWHKERELAIEQAWLARAVAVYRRR